MNFDETVRFRTNPSLDDTDGDGVKDKDDIWEYVFDANGHFDKREADFDQDGLRKEQCPFSKGIKPAHDRHAGNVSPMKACSV